MLQIDLTSRKPIYEQIVDLFKELIITQVYKPDDKAPSVRDLAKELTINPNTIQKAYKELENQNYMYKVIGQGSFIAQPPDQALNTKRVDELKEIVTASVLELHYLQCPYQDIIKLVDTALENNHGGMTNDKNK